MAFTVLTLSQLAHVLAIRSERDSLWSQGIASNLPLLGAVVFTLALQIAVLYVPLFNALLSTDPLTAAELAFCVALSTVVFVAVEAEKWLVRRGWLYAAPESVRAGQPGAAGVE
jgi:Ca2+-transporting ATPase